MRVGIGYDAHRLVEGRTLVLGGVEIPHSKGLLGHSDADVLVHAICDAVLGAVGKGDIGAHFPDTDGRFKGILSLKLLDAVSETALKNGFKCANVDSAVVAQQPKLAPYIEQMKNNIAACLKIPVEDVNIKATTTEGMGFEGRQEGISAQAVVLMVKTGYRL